VKDKITEILGSNWYLSFIGEIDENQYGVVDQNENYPYYFFPTDIRMQPLTVGPSVLQCSASVYYDSFQTHPLHARPWIFACASIAYQAQKSAVQTFLSGCLITRENQMY
jgi:hypothetical protein